MINMNKDNKNNESKAKEPEVAFNTIQIFDSFEEQEKEEMKWLASLTPEQHLQNTTSLIKRIFADSLEKHPEIGKQITFK